jgi:copper chaperone CopZ
MKTIKFIFLTAIILSANAFALSAQTDKKEAKKNKTEEVTFLVSMHCHNCQAKIEKNIPWEKGVKDLSIDLDAKTVKIVYDPKKNDEEKLKKAIENLEFTVEKQ